MGFTYNKSKRAWYRDDGALVRSGNRVKTSDGTYYQLNSDGSRTKVGTISGGIDPNFAAMAKKRGLNIDLENKAMRAGLIKDKEDNKWRLDSDTSKDNARVTQDGLSYFKGSDGQWYNFNTGLRRDQDVKSAKVKAKKAIDDKMGVKPTDTWGERFKQKGIIGGLVDGLMDGLHVDENSGWRTAADLGSSFIYSVPILGTVLSAADAGIQAANGDWGGAALTFGMGFLPGGKTASKFVKGSRALRMTNKLLPKNRKLLTQAQKARLQEIAPNRKKVLGIFEKDRNAVAQARQTAPKTVEELKAMGSKGEEQLQAWRTAKLGRLKHTYTKPEIWLGSKVAPYAIAGGAYKTFTNAVENEALRNQYQQDYAQQFKEHNLADLGSNSGVGRIGNSGKGQLGIKEIVGQDIDDDSWNAIRRAKAYGYDIE